MKLIAINGSPRKNGNTATLLKKTIEGARSAGAETELIHLYDLTFKGCTSCFTCKSIDSPDKGRCAMNDDLTPVLKLIEDQAGALVLGTPIYFGSMSGEMRSFMERLLFAPLVYSQPPRSLFPRKLRTGMIYTMNVSEEMCIQRGYRIMMKAAEASLKMILGEAETLCCYDTYQFPDYSKVVMEHFDPEKKASRRKNIFPADCQKAYDLGHHLVAQG
ncbi:MAG TPA: flavodoxin family protein [Nitrospirota bacterium]|nr:flavodoxin family protein [Nitrospirota bacterium]